MPTKFLKPKNMRRGLLALLLVAPLVYMFGSLFFALNGAHGAFPLSDSEYNSYQTPIVDIQSNDKCKFVFKDELTFTGYFQADLVFTCNGTNYNCARWSNSSNIFDYRINNTSSFRIVYSSAEWVSDNFKTIYFEGSAFLALNNSNKTIFLQQGEMLTLQPDMNPINNSDYLFGQFFAKDNWVASLGEKAVNNETGIGLPFVGDLISYIDENAMPLSNSAYGYFIWGYSSYILNVLAIYMVVSIAASLVLIPMKVVDSLEERING